jgi:PAN domain
VIFLAIVLIKFSQSETVKQCPEYQTHFEKILGYRPTTVSSLSSNYGAPFEQKILFKSYLQVPSVINLQCMELCRNDHNCDSYVLNFNKSECYGFTSNERRLETHNLRRLDDHELVEDISVVYFVKTCLNS